MTTYAKGRPTKRAANGGDSARLTGIFYAQTFFCPQALVHSPVRR